jgi:hypothetical protein
LAADFPRRATASRITALTSAIERHRVATGELPRNPKQLAVVARLYAPSAAIPRGSPVDGWERPFVYRPAPESERGYLLYSVGANGRDESGEGDDLGPRSHGKSAPASQGVERAIQVLPMLSLLVAAPIGWTFIRSARRGLG